MRKYAILKEAVYRDGDTDSDLVKKIMIYYEKEGDVYLFFYTTVDEYGSCCTDYFFNNLEDADEYAFSEYGLKSEDWILIDDPLPFCQHDIIHPIRVKGRNTGKLVWDELEIFDGTKWVDFDKNRIVR